MTEEFFLIHAQPSVGEPVEGRRLMLPRIIQNAGEAGKKRFYEFFTVNIRNPHTRRAYARATMQFLSWCEARGRTDLRQIEPMLVAAYIENHQGEPQSVKQSLSAI